MVIRSSDEISFSDLASETGIIPISLSNFYSSAGNYSFGNNSVPL